MRTRTLLATLIASLVAAPAAAAQAPPDEHAAARAYADAALRFSHASGEAIETWVDFFKHPPACVRGVPRAHRTSALLIGARTQNRKLAQELAAPLFAFRSELANTPTADATLISGRAVWRRIGRYYETVEAPEGTCGEIRAWRRAGYPRAVVRDAIAELRAGRRVLGARGARKLHAAAERMVELGVPEHDAEVFVNAEHEE